MANKFIGVRHIQNLLVLAMSIFVTLDTQQVDITDRPRARIGGSFVA